MDQGAILQQFCSMTGVDTDFALSFLEANAWDVEYCINLYLEGNAGGNMGDTPKLGGGISAGFSSHDEQGSVGAGEARTFSDEDIARAMSEEIPPEIYSDSQMVDDDGVRAPILPKSEVLVEDDPMRLIRRRPKPVSGDPNNVFEMFRDFNKESRAVRGGTPDDQHNKKLKTLADIFRPPVDLIVPGPFDEVKNTAQMRKKWLLVNIQEVSVFECQMMNRDTWSDAGVKSIVKSHFVLWQVLKPSEEGARYCRYYSVEILPHIAIIDSRTGERLDVLEGFVAPTALITMLEKFVATHSLDDSKPSRPKPQSPKRLGDLSEEAQLAAAMAASLGQAGDPIPDINNSSSSSSSSSSSAPTSTTTTSTTSTSTSTTTTPTVATPATPPPPSIPKEEPPKPAAPRLPDNFKEEHSNPSAERTCVIQIRTPSGAIKGHFRPEDTLLTVWQYVSLHLESNTQFSLVTSFPKTTYSGEKLSMTLKQAELVPRAVLICELN